MKKVALFLFTACITFISCGTKRNLVYFSDLKDTTTYKAAINNQTDPLIQPDDILSINVSSLNPESNVLFNKGTLIPVAPNNKDIGSAAATGNNSSTLEGYMVDRAGMVNFPVIGKIKLGGMRREDAQQKITDNLQSYVKNPIVNIRFLNFKVTVIGEVNKPSTFVIPGERINVLEALGMAGDMTTFGKRENVLVIREKEGIRTMQRINLNNKDVFTSPYFYLQQNDVVYVEPENKEKAAQTSVSYRLLPILTATISALAIILTGVL